MTDFETGTKPDFMRMFLQRVEHDQRNRDSDSSANRPNRNSDDLSDDDDDDKYLMGNHLLKDYGYERDSYGGKPASVKQNPPVQGVAKGAHDSIDDDDVEQESPKPGLLHEAPASGPGSGAEGSDTDYLERVFKKAGGYDEAADQAPRDSGEEQASAKAVAPAARAPGGWRNAASRMASFMSGIKNAATFIPDQIFSRFAEWGNKWQQSRNDKAREANQTNIDSMTHWSDAKFQRHQLGDAAYGAKLDGFRKKQDQLSYKDIEIKKRIQGNRAQYSGFNVRRNFHHAFTGRDLAPDEKTLALLRKGIHQGNGRSDDE